jgi:hypothetical protein
MYLVTQSLYLDNPTKEETQNKVNSGEIIGHLIKLGQYRTLIWIRGRCETFDPFKLITR